MDGRAQHGRFWIALIIQSQRFGSVAMDEFIRRANMALFTRRLSDPALTDGQRKLLLSLLLKASQKQSFDPCQSAGGKTPLLASGSQPGELS